MLQSLTQQTGTPVTPTQPSSLTGTPSSASKHTCPHCSQSFTRHHNLKSHLLTHSHEKPFTCATCSSKFRRLHDLKRHSKLHTGEKPYVCGKCGRKFARGDALARHGKGANGCAGRADGDNSEDDDVDGDEEARAGGSNGTGSGLRATPSHLQTDFHQHKPQQLPSIRTQDGSSAHSAQQQHQQVTAQKVLYGQQTYSPAVTESPRMLSPLPHAYASQQSQQPPPGAHGPPGVSPQTHQQLTGGPGQSPQSASVYSNFGLMQTSNSAQSANAFLQTQPFLQAQAAAAAAAAAAAGHHHSALDENPWSYIRTLEERVREQEERIARFENRLGMIERDYLGARRS
ncbi:uncharacterized protein V1516DRAFT_675034 [Lipomyces oligophaga]|uniref:uncharacterized protein n=1 Tax=Lipomyces oligophaga TaxID=45792 RepID=UPI0034CDD46B